MPTFSVPGGTYNSTQTVTIADTAAGAMLYCTTDGTTPTTSSPQCTQPTTISKSEFLQAMAVAPGGANSSVASAAYTIDLTAAATPTFSPAGGTYTSSQTVTIADTTPGVNLYYTLDGTAPTSSSTLYTGPVAVSKTETLSAIAIAPAFNNSGVASAAYTISTQGGNPSIAATPTISPAGGSFASSQQVSIADTTAAATIYYTTDETTPTSSSKVYNGPITVSQSEVVNAIAVASGFSNSSVSSANFTIGVTASPTAAPVFFPNSGAISSGQAVTIIDATSGASIYYTTNGSTPTASSTLYTAPVTVSTAETIKAIAIASGGSSAVTTSAYTIASPSPAPPNISPGSGPITTAQTVTITDVTAGAAIYFTTDGSTPTASSMQYSAPIALTTSGTETIKAIAVASGSSSAVAVAAYTITTPPTAPPVISPGSGAITTAQTVTITDATAGAAIYYTTDGSTPTTSSTRYSAPIALTTSGTEMISAIAVVSGNSSGTVAATYTVSIPLPTLSGTVLSGAVPVNGAQVQLYAAGQTGYGSAATPLLTNFVSTDSKGAFSFSYNCPAAPGDLVYLVVIGGNTGQEPNFSLELMTALGSCSTLTGTTPVVVNEITTVASAYALSPFITALPDVGTSGPNSTTGTPGNYQGLANAFKTVSNMVNLATGQAYSITPAYAANPVPYLNSSTVPQSRINTLANMLNVCAGSGSCANLFSNATPAGGTIPSNTLQAILNIAQNPGNNATALFPLASPTGPFQPVLSAAPVDWTLALTFTGGGLGIAPGTATTQSDGTSGVPMTNSAMAIDATGNIWITAYNSASPSVSNSLIAEFNNQGAPLTPATTLSNATPALVTYGGYLPGTQGAVQSNGIAIDQTGNLWMGSGANPAMAEISPGFSALQGALPLSASATGGIAVDSTGNVWAGVSGALNEFSSSGNMLSPSGGWSGQGSPGNSFGYDNLGHLVFDSTGNLWGADNDGSGDMDLINQADGTIPYDPLFSGAPYSSIDPDSSGNVYTCGGDGTQGASKMGVYNGNSQSLVGSFLLSVNCGDLMVLDGQGHLFMVSDPLPVSGKTLPGFVTEYSTAGLQISPNGTGYTGTSFAEAPTINPDPSLETGIAGPSPSSSVTGTAIDGSGNLWVLNGNTGHPFIQGDPGVGIDPVPASPGNVLVQFVGIAAPVVTPVSVATKSGQLGVRP